MDLTAVNPPRLVHQAFEQIEFARGQFDMPSLARGLVGEQVEGQIADAVVSLLLPCLFVA